MSTEKHIIESRMKDSEGKKLSLKLKPVKWGQLDDNLQNIILSEHQTGEAFTGEWGNDTRIGIHQKKLTQEHEARLNADGELQGQINGINSKIGSSSSQGTIMGRLDALEGAVGDGGSVDSRIEAAKDEVIGGATSDGNTLKKIEDRVSPLENAVGSGGSIDARIAEAKAEIIGNADLGYNTLGKLENELLNEEERAIAADNDRYTKSETYSKEQLNNLITTPEQEYVTVTATDQTTDVTDVLPATGEADTVYRVGNWDGTEYDISCYSEYAWDGSGYVFLDVKEYTIATAEDFDSPNAAKRAKVVSVGAAADVFGEYIDNPEWIRVIIDKDGRIIAGIKKGGSVDWGAGVPQCVKDEISAALESKVDKVEGKGLSTNDYSNDDKSLVAMNSIVNDENCIKMTVDKDGRIIEKIYKNGDRYIYNVKSETLDRIEEMVSSMGDFASECSDNDALLLRKHVEDNWPYWTDVDTSDPQSYDVESYIDGRIRSVDATANKVMFVTDSHWNVWHNPGKMVSNDIMSYVKERMNVPKVIFGGDAIGEDYNRYKAMTTLKKYYNSALSAFGKDFIPVIGDHDQNTFPGMGDTEEEIAFERANYIDFKDTLKVILEQIQNYAVFDDEMIAKVDTLFSGETEDLRNELKQMLRCHYYVDDAENKVRYLILYSGAPHPMYLMDDFLKTHATPSLILFTQFDFIAKSLKSLPEGYSVIVATHKIADTTLTENGVSFRGMRTAEQTEEMGLNHIPFNIDLCAMLSAFKMKRSVTIHNGRGNTYKNISKFFTKGDHVYDFSDAPNAKKVLGLSGHVHFDNSYLAGTIDGVYKSFYYQSDVPLPEDAILWIGFNTENRQRCHSPEEVIYAGPNASGSVMTANTVNETSFDVVTWDEQKVICTRFGGGVQQRIFNY